MIHALDLTGVTLFFHPIFEGNGKAEFFLLGRHLRQMTGRRSAKGNFGAAVLDAHCFGQAFCRLIQCFVKEGHAHLQGIGHAHLVAF